MSFSGFGKPATTTTSTTNTTTTTGGGMFGGASNTGTGNAFGGFGQQQAGQQQTNSLFGGGSTANPAGATGQGLFGQQQQQPAQQQQPTTGLFGQQQTQQPAAGTTQAGGLFGQQQQQNAPAAPSLFGSSTTGQQGGTGLFGNTTTQQPAGGLFGNAQQPAQQQTGGGLFGNTQQPAQQQSGGGLFGNTQQPAQQQSGGGLFGNTQQPAQQQSGGGLFGNTNTAQQSTGGLFGNSTNTQTGGTGLFGSTNNANQPGAAAGGMFAANNFQNPFQAQAQATQFPGGFGGTTGTGFGGSMFNKQPSQNAGQQTQQGQLGLTNNNQTPPFNKSTKFNDLPDGIRKVLEDIDSHIEGRLQISKELKQRKLGEEPTKGQASIRDLHKELIDLTNTIRKDVHLTKDLKDKVDQAVEDTIVATRIVDGYRNPQSGNTFLKDHANFPLEFFTRVTEQMGQRLAWYKSTIEQIERKLSASTSQVQTPQGIVQTLQTQHTTFLALASKTAALDGEVQKLKAIYTQLWRSRTGSVRDPFNDSVKPGSESGLDYSLSGLNLSSSGR